MNTSIRRSAAKIINFIIAVACYALAVIFASTLLRAEENAPAVSAGTKEIQKADLPAAEPSLGLLMSTLDIFQLQF